MVSVFVQYSCANTDDFEKYALIPGASKVIGFQWVIEWRRGLLFGCFSQYLEYVSTLLLVVVHCECAEGFFI